MYLKPEERLARVYRAIGKCLVENVPLSNGEIDGLKTAQGRIRMMLYKRKFKLTDPGLRLQQIKEKYETVKQPFRGV